MKRKASKVEPSNVIDGKPVREYVDLPYGEFVKLVHKVHDPLWGLFGKVQRFDVLVEITKIKRESEEKWISVEALSKDDAEKEAEKFMREEAVEDDWLWDDIEIGVLEVKKEKADA